eukprot:CAMPEP_0119115720 /NCGR_PEP_ID=MMETSP1180-20130426/51896_1 /TAXON_ID=3052 ORGANISM="Chlamydomonas cf sp, Strain CCMP681" /NCGR_SAMPLE_ID=MMETSP1180 /ASSEMBLY_ACC=CAM_ASM_000741 /LENGTH=221 /DNA_ID=CAMNT_0007104809 /DNA_START=476 /DNA_END=1140 /DNA_ORIENTATION=-
MYALTARSAASCTAVVSKPQRQAVKAQASLKPSSKVAPAVNMASASSMMVWQPVNNKQFETFSYLPPLTSAQIAKQVDYIVANGWVPCLEFAAEEDAYVSSASTIRFCGVASNYYDNRYWTMWKLPMFGCTDAGAVLTEVSRCTKSFPAAYVRLVAFDNKRQVQIISFLVFHVATKSFPAAYVRLVAFDNKRQVQIISFLVQRPNTATDYCDVAKRSVAGA